MKYRLYLVIFYYISTLNLQITVEQVTLDLNTRRRPVIDCPLHIKFALAYLRPDFILARSINFLLKSVASAGGFNFIQPGFEPPLN